MKFPRHSRHFYKVIYLEEQGSTYVLQKWKQTFSFCSGQMSVKASAFSLDSGASDWPSK